MKHIVAYSGGVASAYVAKIVLEENKEAIIYFNDTKWEHPDLYRFNSDIEKHLRCKIYIDSDGRNPEEVFFDQHMLGNNRAPICSRVLKANRLQKFAVAGDIVYFGITEDEIHRAGRIRAVYTPKGIDSRFPLIEQHITKKEIFDYWVNSGIEIPYMYKVGFEHNNCSGGCVRAGKKSWTRLLETDPATYEKRSDVERRFNMQFNSHYSFIKGCTLDELKDQVKNKKQLVFDDDGWEGECVGICSNLA